MPTKSTPKNPLEPTRVIWMAQEIVQRPIDVLLPFANTPRRHTDKNISRLARSIQSFGFVVPILIAGDGTLIAGHGRLAAAKHLGLKTVPTVSADHLSAAQVRALRIADNRLAELSDWNREALQIEFSDLVDLSLSGELDFDLDLTGFEMPEIDLIVIGAGEEETAPAETLEEPDLMKPAVTKPGDLWMLGRHRLLCGDALLSDSYKTVLGDAPVRLVFTDPPYNVPVNGHVRSGRRGDHREFVMASGEMTDAAFRVFLSEVITRATDPLVEGGIAMVCMDWRHIEELIAAGKACGLELINLCVWNKTNGGMGGLYRSKHELVCIFRKPGAAHVNNVQLGKHGRNRTNVWDYAGVNSFGKGREADLADHPTVKPTALVADALLDVTHRGDVVLDCFGGSGSTLLAAEKTGRRARLIELDRHYRDVAIRRWQEMTEQDAVHAATGETWSERAAATDAKDGYENAEKNVKEADDADA